MNLSTVRPEQGTELVLPRELIGGNCYQFAIEVPAR
jgi:hypothetical protein